MKSIKVKFPNGHKFIVPAEVIAKARAEYYAEKEPPYEKTYKEEFEYTMGSPSEIMDWVQNNMNWEDLKDSAQRVKESNKPYDYERNWHKAKVKTD